MVSELHYSISKYGVSTCASNTKYDVVSEQGLFFFTNTNLGSLFDNNVPE